LSKQFTIVLTKSPGSPQISVDQLLGGLTPILTKAFTEGVVIWPLPLAIWYSPLNATSPGLHEIVEIAEIPSPPWPASKIVLKFPVSE
jgi:hypothetical protein